MAVRIGTSESSERRYLSFESLRFSVAGGGPLETLAGATFEADLVSDFITPSVRITDPIDMGPIQFPDDYPLGPWTIDAGIAFLSGPLTVVTRSGQYGGGLFFVDVVETPAGIVAAPTGTIEISFNGPIDFGAGVSLTSVRLELDAGGAMVEPLPFTPPGDTNSNGHVGFGDFAILADRFGAPGRWSDGDFDDDQIVGFSDFVLLAENFPRARTAAPISVPEPSALVLLMMGFLLAACSTLKTPR
jgi:hypothetical protein